MKEVTMNSGSVKWFLDKLIEHQIIKVNQTTYEGKYKHENLLEQAKAMHKEEIINALLFGDVLSPTTAENYYKVKFGGNNEP
jgi:hypothetical protein